MAYSYSTSSGCNANSAYGSQNPSPLLSTHPDRAAHINELQDAIEEYWANHSLGYPENFADATTGSTVAGDTVRIAHINELRVAINKLRVSAYRCLCHSNGCCICHLEGGCWMGGQPCTPQHYSSYSPTMSNYTWSNESVNNDNGSTNRKTTVDMVSVQRIAKLRSAINNINSGAYGSAWITGLNQSF